VKSLSTRRRHPLAAFVVLALGLAFAGALFAAFVSPSANADTGETAAQQLANGKALYTSSCSSCHGPDASGTSLGPSLVGVGAASVDFQVSTGRMPAKQLGPQVQAKQNIFSAQQVLDMAAYIQSLGGGPQIPAPQQYSTDANAVALGGVLFRETCTMCHNIGGEGGALTDGKFAPALTQSTNTQIYEAMLTGPEAMPVFNDLTITPQEKRDIIAYVTTVRSEPNPGGFSLGRVGPVTEGLVAFLGLLFFMVLAALWITAKHGKAHE
jgi:ubiquinol-cytochrome c reductase cytochrome c subunit